jgi:hypothetical protein
VRKSRKNHHLWPVKARWRKFLKIFRGKISKIFFKIREGKIKRCSSNLMTRRFPSLREFSETFHLNFHCYLFYVSICDLGKSKFLCGKRLENEFPRFSGE